MTADLSTRRHLCYEFRRSCDRAALKFATINGGYGVLLTFVSKSFFVRLNSLLDEGHPNWSLQTALGYAVLVSDLGTHVGGAPGQFASIVTAFLVHNLSPE